MRSRHIIKQIFGEALNAAMPANLLRNLIRIDDHALYVKDHCYRRDPKRVLYVFGSGKSSLSAARVLEDLLHDRIAGGLIVSNYDDGSLRRVRAFVSAHPVPDERSIQAADLLMDGLSKLGSEDFFIYILSGGTSSLVEKPIPPLTLKDVQRVSSFLLRRGLTIAETNVVRKHLSLVKGGKLGRLTRARGIVLVISDVIGDDLETIGSAPLYCDRSTYLDAYDILCRSCLWDQTPTAVRAVIEMGLSGELEDNPKHPPGNMEHILIGSNTHALMKARDKAHSLGLNSYIMSSHFRGEAREAAKAIIAIGEEIVSSNNPCAPPACLLFGGETTVSVRGNGKGGRNQEMCLAALKEIGNRKSFTFLSAGTDGVDGNSEAAGAVVDHHTYDYVVRHGLRIDDYLYRNDSYGLLERAGALIITGPTGTNVMDITILLIGGNGL